MSTKILLGFSVAVLLLAFQDCSGVHSNTSANLSGTQQTGMAASARLDWSSASVTGQDRYLIEQSIDGVAYVPIQTLAGDATSYTVDGLSHGGKYYFRISGSNAAGSSGYKVVSLDIP